MNHVHAWVGMGSRTKGIFRRRHFIILGCICGARMEAEVR